MQTKKIAANADQYIAMFPEEAEALLKHLRATIIKIVPAAEEVISYGMPAYKYHGMLVYFAGYKNHIGFYPGASAIKMFKKEISIYKNAKGSVQFPLNKPLPVALITKMVKFKMKDNLEKEELRTRKKKRSGRKPDNQF